MQQRRRHSLLCLILLVITLVLTLTACNPPDTTKTNSSNLQPNTPTPTPHPNKAPDFTLPTLEGTTITLSQIEGRPVVLVFWATWCPYCRIQLRYLEAAAKQQNEKSVMFLGVNVGETKSKIENFFGDYQPTMIVALDETRAVFNEYNSRFHNPGYMPITFFIDSQGVVKQVRVGAFANEAELWNNLDKLS